MQSGGARSRGSLVRVAGSVQCACCHTVQWGGASSRGCLDRNCRQQAMLFPCTGPPVQQGAGVKWLELRCAIARQRCHTVHWGGARSKGRVVTVAGGVQCPFINSAATLCNGASKEQDRVQGLALRDRRQHAGKTHHCCFAHVHQAQCAIGRAHIDEPDVLRHQLLSQRHSRCFVLWTRAHG